MTHELGDTNSGYLHQNVVRDVEHACDESSQCYQLPPQIEVPLQWDYH